MKIIVIIKNFQKQIISMNLIIHKFIESVQINIMKRTKIILKMFIISLIFGILVIVGRTIFISTNSISRGLMFGSLMFIIYGTGRYWNYMDDLVRFIILSIALVVLIYVSYWTSKKMKDGNKRTRKSEKRK